MMWRRGHVSAPQLANWTGTGPRRPLCGAMVEWAKWFGPTGIVGLGLGRDKGGVIRPIGRLKGLKSSSLIYATKPIYFFCVGLNDSLIFIGYVAPCGAWDQSE